MERKSMNNKPINDSDEPLYNRGPHLSSFATEVFCQNFDFGGFIKVLKYTYNRLTSIFIAMYDSSSDDDDMYLLTGILPFCMFQHVMVNHLNHNILKTAWNNGHRDFPDPRARIFSGYSCIPKPIADYISHVSDAVSRQGITVKLNLPKIAVPQGPIGDIPSGTFGVINEHTHNVYECYISPLVTANRVIASVKNTPDYQPLPSAIISSDLIPNKNLLGYGPIDKLSAYTPAYLLNLDFPDNDTIEGRLKICSSLVQHVHSTMARMRNKIKMVEVYSHHNIIPKTVVSNTCFVESMDNTKILFEHSDLTVYSIERINAITANEANFYCLHRHRVAKGDYSAVGSCYCAADGSVPAGWAATCNSNFEMNAVFAPVLYSDCPELRFKRICNYGSHSSIYNIIEKYCI